MNARQLSKLGIPPGAVAAAQRLVAETARAAGLDRRQLKERLEIVLADPKAAVGDAIFGELARAILAEQEKRTYIPRICSKQVYYFNVWT